MSSRSFSAIHCVTGRRLQKHSGDDLGCYETAQEAGYQQERIEHHVSRCCIHSSFAAQYKHVILIELAKHMLNVDCSPKETKAQLEQVKQRRSCYTFGVTAEYAQYVSSASGGAMTSQREWEPGDPHGFSTQTVKILVTASS